MADISFSSDHPADASVTPTELRDHERSYIGFERLVLFAAIHVALVLVCLALAFIGHIPALALLLGVGGSFILIAAFAIYGSLHDV